MSLATSNSPCECLYMAEMTNNSTLNYNSPNKLVPINIKKKID